MTIESRTLNVGVVGLGSAGAGAVPSIKAMPYVNLVAAVDTNPRALENFRERHGAKTNGSIEELCKDPEVDTVWIATPTPLHCPHTVLAANSGKHVVVEKPMSVSLSESQQMIEAAEKNGVKLICGGSRRYSPVVTKMRELVRDAALGPLEAMTTWAATDWMLRPRRQDEYDVSQGGGVAYRQAPHQVDSIRLIGGGRVRSVRGMTGQWMAPRSTAPGCFTALLEFEDGVFATLIYNGYGYFSASELFDPGAAGPNAAGLEDRIEARRQIMGGTRDELAAKEQQNLGRAGARPAAPAGATPSRGGGLHGDLGVLVVSCEHGDIRQSPGGLYVYGDDGTTELPLAESRAVAHRPELQELNDEIVHSKAALHSGRWGLATMEVCLAIMQSAREHREIAMEHQVAVPARV